MKGKHSIFLFAPKAFDIFNIHSWFLKLVIKGFYLMQVGNFPLEIQDKDVAYILHSVCKYSKKI